MNKKEPSGSDRLYELLDTQPERISVRENGTVVARYKNYTVEFMTFTVKANGWANDG